MMVLTLDVNLTENEHYIVEDDLRKICEPEGLTVEYTKYEPHRPMHRKVVIKQPHGNRSKLLDILLMMEHAENVEYDHVCETTGKVNGK